MHSYPHCWRCKKPVIFRATEQWFISVDHNDLRGRTLKGDRPGPLAPRLGPDPDRGDGFAPPRLVHQPPAIVGRADPGPGCTACQAQLLTAETVRHFRDLFRSQGADVWFTLPVEELVPAGARCAQCGGTSFRKEGDILDVWFESGSSHRAVLAKDFNLGYPAFMYLEGSDQHRGWFQSSILTAVGTTGTAPFETVLTHGFVVDDKGRKISKSEGNYIPADKMITNYGADVLRLYVASMDYANDISVSERGIKEMSEAYRKIRNTFRYLLGNLEDYQRFDPDSVDAEQAARNRSLGLGPAQQGDPRRPGRVRKVRVLPGLPADLPVLRRRAFEFLPRRLEGPALRRGPGGPRPPGRPVCAGRAARSLDPAVGPDHPAHRR